MRKDSLLIHSAIVVVLVTSSLCAEVLYHVTDLGTLGRGESMAYSINNKGQIVGEAEPNLDYWYGFHAAIFDPTGDGNNVDLNAGSRDCGHAYGINTHGQIVGWMNGQSARDEHAMLFDPTGDGNNIDLDTPEGWTSYALSINDAGQIVGWSFYFSTRPPLPSVTYATIFDPTGNGDHIDLGTLGGKRRSKAYSINNRGQIVGEATTASGQYRATLFDPTGQGNNIDLGALTDEGESEAHCINDKGQIAGSSDGRATLFDPNASGDNIDLGMLPGASESWANSINNAGEIVGASSDSSYEYSAMLFDPTGQGNNINLNDVIEPGPAWHLEEALCINDSGWIVGYGKNPAGVRHAFLLTPISLADSTLILNVEPNDVGINTINPAPGEHKYLLGRAVVLEAQLFKACPAVYHFDHWQGDVIDPNSPLTTVIMNEDKVVTAVFVAFDPVCGDECHPILQGDLNGDCYINFTDFVLYSSMWMSCTHPDCD